FLIERFYRNRTADLGRLLLLRLHWDRFPNRWNRNGLPNFRSGLRRLSNRLTLACGITCWLQIIYAGCAIGPLIFGCFRCLLRHWLRFQCWLNGIVGVLVSYQRRTLYGDWHDFIQVHGELSSGQIAGTKFASEARTRFSVNIAWLGGRLRGCSNLHV